jgi:hypothetical protein
MHACLRPFVASGCSLTGLCHVRAGLCILDGPPAEEGKVRAEAPAVRGMRAGCATWRIVLVYLRHIVLRKAAVARIQRGAGSYMRTSEH